ncbi:AAA family ATPase [Fuchsiella alkaliacetigena]|uniref:AAA family ATPase n=1 Tax=Fuchsiella alkaliacetigena TaxID=957042 RepID=UPI00200AB547|nr:AAA family ATPase [Fuchsiella alkaliacetigena]MCK8825790.1 AAA family ATPase [Fuchsiella alkaliacetigena]
MQEKIKKIISKLNKGLVEREKIIKISFLTLLAQENLILIGPPGTAKSEISRRLSQVVKDGQYFEYLLTKFTTPEEIFGPLSIQKLKEDKFKRNTDAYLPQASVAFLDEIFKANSAILNSLLTIINEKKFHNGKVKEDVPLLSLVGASNELPIDDNELNALYDRFLVRKVVDYVDDESISALFAVKDREFKLNDEVKFSSKELEMIKEGSQEVKIPESIQRAIKEIRLDFKDEFEENSAESFSDRKFVKILKLLRVSAFTNGRGEVDYSDLLLLRNCLWSDYHNIKATERIIIEVVEANCADDEVKLEESISSEAKSSAVGLKGSGTAKDPFLIEDVLDLYCLDDEEHRGEGYYFKQVKNIDLSAEDWKPINDFNGHYDGNNKKISNLTIKLDGLKQIGLFGGITESSSIRNVKLEDVEIDVEGKCTKYAGGLIGKNKGEISNSYVTGNISTSASDSSYGGGIAGMNEGEISNSYVTGNISTSASDHASSYGGGIAGMNEGEISNSYATGNVSISASDFSYGGGIAGMNEGEISNSYVTGNVSISASDYVSSYGGGIAGMNRGEILNSYVTGNVSSFSKYASSYGGGIAGENEGEISNCVALNKEISSKSYNNRIAKNDNGELKNNYAIKTMLLNEEEINRSNIDGKEGKSISEKLLKNKFFQKNIGWDFDEVWSWNQEEKRPVLKLGNEAESIGLAKAEKGKKTKSELIKQIEENIWL